MKIDREKVKKIFAEYVRHYGAEEPKILLKILHTYKVSGLCGEITHDLLCPAKMREKESVQKDIDLAWLIGMLHDIGRFEQVRRYHTLLDAASVSHAALGIQILFDEGMLMRFITAEPEDEDVGVIRAAIAYHSDYRIPEALEERTRMFCQILRDADKIDIFRVNCETPLEDIYQITREELMHAEVSEDVMENFMQRRATPRELRKTPVDYLVGMISMAFELVYPVSRKIAARQGYLDRLLAFPSENEKTRQQFAVMRKYLEFSYLCGE